MFRGRVEKRYETQKWVECRACGQGFWGGRAAEMKGQPCGCGKGTYEPRTGEVCLGEDLICGCGKEGDRRYDRYGIYAGIACDKCYKDSGLAGWKFDPAYAGERLEPEDY